MSLFLPKFVSRISLVLFGLVSFSLQAAVETAGKADDFVDRIGMGIKPPSWQNYALVYANTDLVKSKLGELGVRHIRFDSKDVDGDWAFINDLYHTYGIRTNLLVSWYYTNLAARLQANVSCLESVEGPNETNVPNTTWIYNGAGFPSGTIAMQNDLYNLVKGNPVTKSLPVITPSIYQPGDQSQLVNCLGDYENMHSYPAGGKPTKLLDDLHIPSANMVFNPDKSIIATETGYNTALQAGGSVTEKAQGKYVPRLLGEYWNRNIARTYFYILFDHGVDQTDPELTYGFLRNDGTPKPAYTALKNLIALLEEPGATCAPTIFDYTLSGNLTNIRHTLLQKSNGDFYLLIWQDVSVFDGGSRADIANADVPVTCTFATSISAATTYRYDDSGNLVASPATLSGSTLTLSVPDSLLIIKLTPAFKASSGNGKVLLNWPSSSSAVAYTIRRATALHGTYTPILTGTPATSYIDNGLTNGTSYFYKVSPITAAGEGVAATPMSSTPQEITLTLDNADSSLITIKGSWTAGNSLAGYYGNDYLYAYTAPVGRIDSVTFSPALDVPGNYAVFARWTAHINRATNAPFDINCALGTTTVTMNEQLNNATWMPLGNFQFNAGSSGSVAIRNNGANGYVVADAVQFVLKPDPLSLQQVVSRKTHGSVGSLDVLLYANPGPLFCIESRKSGTSGIHQLIFTFTQPVTSGTVSVSSGIASLSGSPIFSGNQMTVNLVNVANQQQVKLSLNTIQGATGTYQGTFTWGVLCGDVNADKTVNASDSVEVGTRTGQVANGTNARYDVNGDGIIDTNDQSVIQSLTPASLP